MVGRTANEAVNLLLGYEERVHAAHRRTRQSLAAGIRAARFLVERIALI